MKKLIALASVVLVLQATAQNSLTKLWSTDTVLAVPESVLFDAKDKLLFVSLIDGVYNAKDGKGEIAKVGLDGKIIDANWVTGLNAPKGLGRYKNELFVADLDELVIIDIKAGKIIKKIPVEGAKFLNDITVSSSGEVYISDSETGKVHLVKKGIVTTVVSGLKRPNGLLIKGKKLYILSSGELFEANAEGKTRLIASGLDAGTDGIEEIKPGIFLVSSWSGVIYIVKENTPNQQLLDTRELKINTADIGYDPAKKIVYVPTFYKNHVVAYQLK